MKRLNIILIALLVVTGTGCKDFLEEDNLSNLETDAYYATAEGYPKLINACYSTLRTVYNDPFMFAAGTDMYVEGRNAQSPGISEYRNLTPEEAVVETFYKNLYASIQICNNALYFNDKTAADPSLPVRKGEAQFLRAYYYFLLVQTYGGVNIVSDRFTAPVRQFKRNTAEEVYTYILKEMNEALALVPETQAEFGRVTKRAIRHYLAKVHLTRGYETFGTPQDFTTAATFADAAINGQALNIAFEDVFYPGNERNAEILFSIQYDPTSILNPLTDGNSQNYWFGAYMGGQGAAQGYPNRSYTLMPTIYTFDVFTQDDSRFDATFMIEALTRYYDYYDKKAERSTLNVRFYYAPKWANSTADIAAWRAANPSRRNAATVIPYSSAWQAGRSTAADNAVPSVKKFDDPKSQFSTSSSTRDIFLARLGETYLIAAEAHLKAGNPLVASQRINEVRKRAAKPTKNLSISAADVTIDFILDERARELVGEYHRWFDLKRTGTLMARTKLYNRDIKKWYDAGTDPFLGTGNQFKILRPIPSKAIDLNEAGVQQNPGY
ncbi:MAG: RagB/SusD family nutrient uptake outer membrane protein [Pyrinomonadaceae bacterium]|nr:RagB/SusD family nutrient uptake outer membrane protein [Sphingobacteriaceae bacterium]